MTKKRKKSYEEPEEKKKFPLWKRALFFFGGALVIAGGYLAIVSDSPGPKKQPVREKTSTKRLSLQDIYDGWMEHCDSKGLPILYVKRMSQTVDRLFTEIEKNPETAQEFLGKPMNDFFSKPQKYEDYPTKFVMAPYCVNFSEKVINERFRKVVNNHPETIRGLEAVINMIKWNPQNMQNFDDDTLSSWLLNASYFITRKNFKSAEFMIETEESINKAFRERIANPEITTLFTQNMYCTLLNVVTGLYKEDKRHLSSRVSSIFGYFLTPKAKYTGPSIWLVYEVKDKTEILETHHPDDDKLFDETFDAKGKYLKGKFKDVFYIPLIRTTLNLSETGYAPEKRIHILPEEIEKEIKH